MSDFRIPNQFQAEFDRAVASLPPEPIDSDIAHVIAIEREAICEHIYLTPALDVEQAESLMRQIRNGEHWKQS